MSVVARGAGVVRITVQRVWGPEGSVLYMNCEGSYTNPYTVELHTKRKKLPCVNFKNKIISQHIRLR